MPQQSEHSITRQTANYKRKCWAIAQYSRRECLEISDIPSSVSDKDLKDVVCKAITKVGDELSYKDIEDYH